MARELLDTKQLRARAHSISIENRERAMIVGVTDVESFNEDEVILVTEHGMITLIGRDLHIARLNLDEGQLVVEGIIDAFDYTDGTPTKKGGMWGRLFK